MNKTTNQGEDMSNQGPQFPPQGGYPQPTTTPQKSHTKRNLILVGVGAFILGLVLGSAGSGTSAPTPSSGPTVTVTAPAVEASPDPVVTATEEPAPEPEHVAPAAKDFKLTVKTLTKQCFGSAGCNVTFRVATSYTGPALDPSKTYEVLYQVRGGEDGPIANKLTVEGTTVTFDEEEMVSTSKSSAKLTAVVTEVLES